MSSIGAVIMNIMGIFFLLPTIESLFASLLQLTTENRIEHFKGLFFCECLQFCEKWEFTHEVCKIDTQKLFQLLMNFILLEKIDFFKFLNHFIIWSSEWCYAIPLILPYNETHDILDKLSNSPYKKIL